jgi:glycosyltransferase involved in cell wall biosynthesis
MEENLFSKEENEMKEILYIVIPCYNEEAVLPETEKRLTVKLQKMMDKGLISEKSRMVFVDDGSKDRTWTLISEMYEKNPYVLGIKSSKNRGHQNTLLEGLMTVKEDCDMAVSMDADLQDDIEVLDQFVEKHYEGCDIVYGVRSARKTDTWFKRTTAEGFYKLMEQMGVNIVYNHADYRLMSRRALNELENFKEVNLFLRGIVPMIGFKTDVVTYERSERFAGESKYPLRKMIAFALDGITSLSIKPIRLITGMGFLLFFVSVILLIYYAIGYFLGKTIHGWATLVISIWGIGGLQLLAIGIVGEYIGKIYLETKARPRYIVEEYLRK